MSNSKNKLGLIFNAELAKMQRSEKMMNDKKQGGRMYKLQTVIQTMNGDGDLDEIIRVLEDDILATKFVIKCAKEAKTATLH